MSTDQHEISPTLRRRVVAAAYAARVNRFEVELEWPECHRPRCAHRHGDPERALSVMQHAIVEAIDQELGFALTTRPDLDGECATPEEQAVVTLATLLATYNVRDAGTFANAAQLIIDAYPEMVTALTS